MIAVPKLPRLAGDNIPSMANTKTTKVKVALTAYATKMFHFRKKNSKLIFTYSN